MGKKKQNQTNRELELLLESTKSVLLYRDFERTARLIFDSCKELTGATAGYIALLSNTGEENEVLFLDAGGRSCDVDPYLPMPIRGLRGLAYKSQKTVFNNDFMNSDHIKFIPKGHVPMPNVLFAPLNIEGKTEGVIGLSNKQGEFTENDARTVSSFSDLCAIALQNSWLYEKQIESNKRINILNEALEMINRILRHDISNDLTVIISSSALYSKTEDKQYLDMIHQAGRKSENLIKRMRELEFLFKKGDDELKSKNARLVLEAIIGNYENFNVEFSIFGECNILADQALYSLFDNIVRNSIKHSGTNRIDIELSTNNDKCKIAITDYGIGISEELLNHINNKTYDLGKLNLTGLGLFIITKTVERYKGDINISLVEPSGTKIEIELLPAVETTYH